MVVCGNALRTTQPEFQEQHGELRKDNRRYGKVQRKASLPDMRNLLSILLISGETPGERAVFRTIEGGKLSDERAGATAEAGVVLCRSPLV